MAYFDGRRAIQVLTEDAQDHEIRLRVGERFSVELREQAMGGFRWVLEESSGSATTLDREMTVPGIGIGAHATHTWEFAAAKPGVERLVWKYGRSWEQDTAERVFRIQVSVAE